MITISKLFGRSPFAPLQAHMEKVAACVEKVGEAFVALYAEDYDEVEKLAASISKLEHAADLTKNDIRERLPKTLFLPVDRGNLLDILSLQDAIADKCEDIGVLLTLRPLKMMESLKDDFNAFLNLNGETFEAVYRIIKELPELLETSFGGNEAEKVREMVDNVAYKEHEGDLLQRKLLKVLFSSDLDMGYQEFQLWLRILEEVGAVSDLSEKLAYRVRMTLELK